MKIKKILIIGANGMLGRAIIDILGLENYELLTPEKAVLDITNKSSLDEFYRKISQI